MISETQSKCYNLLERLSKLEDKKIMDVKMTLEANEIKQKIAKASKLVEKLHSTDLAKTTRSRANQAFTKPEKKSPALIPESHIELSDYFERRDLLDGSLQKDNMQELR